MSERKLSKEECERIAVILHYDTLMPGSVEAIGRLLRGLDAADKEIAALKAQMAGMVILEQVEKAIRAEVRQRWEQDIGFETVGRDGWERFILGSLSRLQQISQSTTTKPAKPAKWSVKYTAQQIWDATHDHCKYALSISRTDAPEDLADEVMDLLVTRSRYGIPTGEKE